ncbi:hypothetical protein [Micromonospora carbonacea]|uniref:hypothetical protein n=1 Tax=Micromonospora carbonacea TaxID=47853 RepID=UPI000944A9FF|nr:hypothetical protein [Micromonospora carbonacea]
MLFTQWAAVTTVQRMALSSTVAVQLLSSPWSVKKGRPTVRETAFARDADAAEPAGDWLRCHSGSVETKCQELVRDG